MYYISMLKALLCMTYRIFDKIDSFKLVASEYSLFLNSDF